MKLYAGSSVFCSVLSKGFRWWFVQGRDLEPVLADYRVWELRAESQRMDLMRENMAANHGCIKIIVEIMDVHIAIA